MSALDMTPEQVTESVRLLSGQFRYWAPETVTERLVDSLKGYGYTATVPNISRVYEALVEATANTIGVFPEIIMAPDSGGRRIRGYFDVLDQRARVECIDDGDQLSSADITPTQLRRLATQLRRLATWSLGAADHLDGVEPPGAPHSLSGCGTIGESAAHAALLRSAPVNLTSSEARKAARKLLELADAHDAGGAA